MTQQNNEVFEEWFDEKLNDIEFQAIADENLCLLVWQAATAASAKHVMELEKKLTVEEKFRIAILKEPATGHNYWERWFKSRLEVEGNNEELQAKIAELNAENKQIDAINASLQANINVLRKWLGYLGHECKRHGITVTVKGKSFTEALASTPAQSLQAHDNEVIEQCAVAMENYHVLEGIPAMYIRALKGK